MMRALNLPEPPNERLEHSPLALVVWQLRFDAQPVLTTSNAGVRLHEIFGGRSGDYPLLEELKNTTVAVQGGLGAVPSASHSVRSDGWRITNRERSTSIVFASEALTVETSAYGRWADDFRPLIVKALEALEEVAAPVIEHRVGLRYVDRMDDRGIADPAGWRGQFQDWALGALNIDGLGQSVAASELTHVVMVDDESSARVRVAVFPDDGHVTGVVDVDVSRENSRALDADDILVASDRFRTACKQLFIASITPELYRALGGSDA